MLSGVKSRLIGDESELSFVVDTQTGVDKEEEAKYRCWYHNNQIGDAHHLAFLVAQRSGPSFYRVSRHERPRRVVRAGFIPSLIPAPTGCQTAQTVVIGAGSATITARTRNHNCCKHADADCSTNLMTAGQPVGQQAYWRRQVGRPGLS
jgi:hypothetical protein